MKIITKYGNVEISDDIELKYYDKKPVKVHYLFCDKDGFVYNRYGEGIHAYFKRGDVMVYNPDKNGNYDYNKPNPVKYHIFEKSYKIVNNTIAIKTGETLAFYVEEVTFESDETNMQKRKKGYICLDSDLRPYFVEKEKFEDIYHI